MEIPENMDQWNVLEKMEQWDTSTTDEDIVKDLTPYLDYVINKLNALDDSILNELDVLKKILPRIETLYRNFQIEVGESVEAYRVAMDTIHMLPGHNNYKLKKVLNDQTGLAKEEKKRILEVWEKKHSKYHCWCLPPNDTTVMEECIRTKSAIISDISDKDEEFTRRINEFHSLVFRTSEAIKIFPLLTHPGFQRQRRANLTNQLKRCESTKHKRLKSTSTHQLKRCESTKHKRLKSTSSPKASGQ